jgi:hypothetical protein
VAGRLPFVFEASGSETHFTNGYDPDPRARAVYAFARPESLARILRDAGGDPEAPMWRAKVQHLPPLVEAGLRPAQVDAIHGIERSLAEQRHDRSLVKMATGAGKTFAAVTEAYRLLKRGPDRGHGLIGVDHGRAVQLGPLDELEHTAAAGASKPVEQLLQGFADGVADHPASLPVAL